MCVVSCWFLFEVLLCVACLLIVILFVVKSCCVSSFSLFFSAATTNVISTFSLFESVTVLHPRGLDYWGFPSSLFFSVGCLCIFVFSLLVFSYLSLLLPLTPSFLFFCIFLCLSFLTLFFFFNAPATYDIYILSLHDAFPILNSQPLLATGLPRMPSSP